MTDIVVGIDDSPSAWAAVTWAASYALRTGDRLRAIHVLERPESWDVYTNVGVPPLVYPDADALDPAWTVRSREMFARLTPEHSWTLQFAQGHPGQVMVDASRDAAVLVLGTREHRGLDRLLNGSVSHYAINHAVCPVVVVPDPGAAAAAESELARKADRDHQPAAS
jgi:nucleotide-binding universal stress UspA family protein